MHDEKIAQTKLKNKNNSYRQNLLLSKKRKLVDGIIGPQTNIE